MQSRPQKISKGERLVQRFVPGGQVFQSQNPWRRISKNCGFTALLGIPKWYRRWYQWSIPQIINKCAIIWHRISVPQSLVNLSIPVILGHSGFEIGGCSTPVLQLARWLQTVATLQCQVVEEQEPSHYDWKRIQTSEQQAQRERKSILQKALLFSRRADNLVHEDKIIQDMLCLCVETWLTHSKSKLSYNQQTVVQQE